MDTWLLVLLGAAGGSLRGLVDVYNQTMAWQEARRAHRKAVAQEEDTGEPPRFREYFDPIPDSVATVVHMGMGAACAVLFGLSGQISGVYAALVVGVSAPTLLTQLGRTQMVDEAVTGVSSTQGPGAEAQQ
ncbi:hypothetical protein [Streptomyces sp. NPDC057257]|uniref:hypothetical protein n=1 Tax=Streptomyces sp. NPDC057257 TaxID=3346071 RepID=UPI0036340AC8